MDKRHLQKKGFGMLRGRKISRSRNMIIQIILCVMILIVIGMFIHQSNRLKNEIRIHEALWIFSKIDDIAHAQVTEMQATGNPHGFTGTEEFLMIDSGYHNAKTVREKFKWAKRMDVFAENVDRWLNQIGGLDNTGEIMRDQKFKEAHDMFNRVQ